MQIYNFANCNALKFREEWFFVIKILKIEIHLLFCVPHFYSLPQTIAYYITSWPYLISRFWLLLIGLTHFYNQAVFVQVSLLLYVLSSWLEMIHSYKQVLTKIARKFAE